MKALATPIWQLIISSVAMYAASAAPFQNGNFETRAGSQPGPLPLGDKSVTGWEVGGTQSNTHWTPRPDELENEIIRFDPIAEGAIQWIQQTFDTSEGVEYRVAFDANNYNIDYLAGVRVEVLDATGGTIIANEFIFGGATAIDWRDGGVFHFTARSSTSTLRFTHISRNRVGATTEIDNVSVDPRAPQAEIKAFPAIKINGFTNTGYRVEYAETTAPAVWKKLADVWINDVPPIIIDTNAPSPGARIYRIVELPPE